MKYRNRRRKKSNKVYIIIIAVLLVIMILPHFKTNPLDVEKAEELKTQQELIQKRADIDIKKKIYEEQSKNAQIFLESINTKTEFILNTIEGTATQKIDRTPNKNGFFDFKNSEIYIETKYKVIMSIPINVITFNTDETGKVNILYDDNDITVKAIETKNAVIENKKWLGKEFSDSEKEAVKELIKDRIRDTYNTNQQIKDSCKKNLNDTVLELARQFKVSNIQFNNDTPTTVTYNYIDQSNVAYGWDASRSVDEVKYVVIHSTSNKSATALNHIHWLNNTKGSSATHFYVDDINVVKALDTTKYAYGLKDNGQNGIHNDNSVQIEICEFDDPVKQEKAIKNAEDFVRDALLPALREQGYNPQIVSHHDSTGKNCPRILFDGIGSEWDDVVNNITS